MRKRDLVAILIVLVLFYFRNDLVELYRSYVPKGNPTPVIVMMVGLSSVCTVIAFLSFRKGKTGEVVKLLLAALGCIAALIFFLWVYYNR